MSDNAIVTINPRAERPRAVIANVLELAGRLGLSSLFLVSAFGKIRNYDATVSYMSSFGVPGEILPFVIAFELFGALAIIFGWQTKLFALLLAGFTLVTAFLFHNRFDDPIQATMFLKNISIAGAFLFLASKGAGQWSLDCPKSDGEDGKGIDWRQLSAVGWIDTETIASADFIAHNEDV